MVMVETKTGDEYNFTRVHISEGGMCFGWEENNDTPRIIPEDNIAEIVPDGKIERKVELVTDKDVEYHSGKGDLKRLLVGLDIE